MTYQETEKKINELRRRDEILFRMAISHLVDVGIRHLTQENIEATCAEIMKEDDSHSFMTNGYKCDLIRLAGELAQLDHIHLLVYIQRHVEYDVGDNAISYKRMKEIANDALCCMQAHDNELWDGFEWVCEMELGMTEDEMIAFGCMIPDDEEEYD